MSETTTNLKITGHTKETRKMCILVEFIILVCFYILPNILATHIALRLSQLFLDPCESICSHGDIIP
jgi:hypothetical protein